MDDRVMKGEMEQGVVTKLHQILRPFLLRRLKCDVELNIPKKYEYILFGWLSEWQASMYKDLIDKKLKDSDGKALSAPPPAAPCRAAPQPAAPRRPLLRRPPPSPALAAPADGRRREPAAPRAPGLRSAVGAGCRLCRRLCPAA